MSAIQSDLRDFKAALDDVRASVASIAGKVEVLAARGDGSDQLFDLRIKALERQLKTEDSVTELRLRALETAMDGQKADALRQQRELDRRAWVEKLLYGALGALGGGGAVAGTLGLFTH